MNRQLTDCVLQQTEQLKEEVYRLTAITEKQQGLLDQMNAQLIEER